MLDLKNELNEHQYQAAKHVDGPLLVIAGAGSGKTRVITYRIANLVKKHGVPPWRIMAVTFTNKAAKEMKERVVELLGEKGESCWISTFHASCAKFLRFHGDIIGLNPKFTIYDDSDQKAMVVRCLKDLAFSDKQFPPRLMQNEISRAKRELVGPNEYPATDFYRERFKLLYELYEKRMREASALDFGDLIYRTVRGMLQSTEFNQAIANRFDYILVDEFQDTNRVQLEMVQQLAAPHGNICVVGDDDQSIYSWRGADITNILQFEKFFPGAITVTLDRNYRSTSNILKASHGVVNRLKGRRPKELWTSSPDGDPISYVEAEDEREEGRLVARAVKDLLEDGYSLSSQAVFYRINAQSRVFEEVFRTMGIPHRVLGGMRFYERAEVKDLLAYLRLVQNPADLAAFIRIVNVPTRGIGKTTVEKLVALAAGKGISVFEAIDWATAEIGAAPGKKLEAFRNMVNSWQAEIDLGPEHVSKRIVEDTGYEAGLKNENTAEADARIENINELVGSISDFESEAEDPSLSNFLELVALQTDVDQADFNQEQVTLMTVHAAKGLEFDVVHVTGLEETLFPYRKGGGDDNENSDLEMEEERRLCYVAMTRARKRLFLHRARARRIFGQIRQEPASRFLRDIPAGIVQNLTPERPKVRPLGGGIAAGARSSMPGSGMPRSSVQRPPMQRPTLQRQGSSKPSGLSAMKRPSRPESDEVWVDDSYDQSSEMSLQPGQRVRHAKFGIGRVIEVMGGSMPKVRVEFTGFGVKTLMANYLEFD